MPRVVKREPSPSYRQRYDPDVHHRRTFRVKGYDYAQQGAYFVTVCTLEREPFFGIVQNDQVLLNEAGIMARSTWEAIPQHYAGVAVAEFVVMPNHIHGIVVLADSESPSVGARLSLPDVVQRFKSMTTVLYRHGVANAGWPPLSGKLWQRNYYEHIVRDDGDLKRIREYIANNPARWTEDKEANEW